MWAHLQILVSAQNFSLWSKYILSCSIMAVNFSRPSIIHITYLHPFCLEEMFVKQVPFWLGQLVWDFLSIFIGPNDSALPNLSSIWHSMWVHLPDQVSGPFWLVAKQLCFILIQFFSKLRGWKSLFTSTSQTTPLDPKPFLLITSAHPSLQP